MALGYLGSRASAWPTVPRPLLLGRLSAYSRCSAVALGHILADTRPLLGFLAAFSAMLGPTLYFSAMASWPSRSRVLAISRPFIFRAVLGRRCLPFSDVSWPTLAQFSAVIWPTLGHVSQPYSRFVSSVTQGLSLGHHSVGSAATIRRARPVLCLAVTFQPLTGLRPYSPPLSGLLAVVVRLRLLSRFLGYVSAVSRPYLAAMHRWLSVISWQLLGHVWTDVRLSAASRPSLLVGLGLFVSG